MHVIHMPAHVLGMYLTGQEGAQQVPPSSCPLRAACHTAELVMLTPVQTARNSKPSGVWQACMLAAHRTPVAGQLALP